ncbi:MAG TPA: helix-turn-helix domain-containing protein [Spirochaetota bacterium]|nr:helix-turn-helix domain-containing protein [Spirochaetota bacterium]
MEKSTNLNPSTQLLTYDDVANILKMSPATLRVWVMQKRIPFIKLGRSVRFSSTAIQKYIESHTIMAGGLK